MDIYELVEVQDCPSCGGPSILEEECKSSFYVMCMECGSRTVNIDYKKEEDRLDAAKRAAHLWNIGKAISSHPGE
ncbi:MAG: Lar family restriction alleviation protein [Eubacteriales bacterium]|nr:Lar family restriction alleviation protein [Eubacteriales bacterium]